VSRIPFIPLLILAAMLNWSTTCCCGESMFVEIVRGGCVAHQDGDGHHGHGPAGTGHSGRHRHSCHKGWGSSFVPAQASEQDFDLVIVSDILSSLCEGSGSVLAGFARGRVPEVPPVDIPLLIQSLLI
jgi:hypothetical protein